MRYIKQLSCQTGGARLTSGRSLSYAQQRGRTNFLETFIAGWTSMEMAVYNNGLDIHYHEQCRGSSRYRGTNKLDLNIHDSAVSKSPKVLVQGLLEYTSTPLKSINLEPIKVILFGQTLEKGLDHHGRPSKSSNSSSSSLFNRSRPFEYLL